MYILLRNNICFAASELPMDEADLQEGERQIELSEIEDFEKFQAILGKLYLNGEFVEPDLSDEEKLLEASASSKQFLRATDWKVTRHRDQLEMGITTSLTESEYQDLLKDRQSAREKVIKPEDPLE